MMARSDPIHTDLYCRAFCWNLSGCAFATGVNKRLVLLGLQVLLTELLQQLHHPC